MQYQPSIFFSTSRFVLRAQLLPPMIISFFIGPLIIKKLKMMQIGELIRTEGPKTHLAKKGTPTMGGIIILFSVLFPVLLWADLSNIYIQLLVFATVWMSLIGFVDDYLKVIKIIQKRLNRPI